MDRAVTLSTPTSTASLPVTALNSHHHHHRHQMTTYIATSYTNYGPMLYQNRPKNTKFTIHGVDSRAADSKALHGNLIWRLVNWKMDVRQ